MARYRSHVPLAAFAPHLETGESLRSWAYGVDEPALAALFPLLLVIPGLMLWAYLRTEYLVGLTDRRVVVLEVKGRKAAVQGVRAYDLGGAHEVSIRTDIAAVTLTVRDEADPLRLKFRRFDAPGNRAHALAVAEALGADVG